MASPSGGSSETSVQAFIHAIEQGRWAGAMRLILLCVAVLAVALAYLGWNFSGFSFPESMDQAQVAREISRGHGFSTRLIRPLAIWQIEKSTGAPPKGNFPDTFNAPLPPLVNAFAVKLAGEQTYGRGVYVATSERAIVIVSMACFLLAVLFNFFLLRRLFDQRLASLATLAVLLSDVFWKYTLSGLPQMLMLLLFTMAMYSLVRALEAHEAPAMTTGPAGEPPEPRNTTPAVIGWLAAAGLLLGLLTLSHGLAGWIALGAVLFAFVHFRARGPVALAALAMFAVAYLPWMVRNYHVSGNPFGLAGFAIFDGLGASTVTRMRSPDGPKIEEIAPLFFRNKVEHGIVSQLTDLSSNTGGNLLALIFFVSLLHPFRRRETASIRWALLAMWACTVFGSAILGGAFDTAVSPPNLGVLFAPLMIGFGIAMALVLFGRTEASNKALWRGAFTGLLLLISGIAMIVRLLPEQKPLHNFPPYFEPAIHSLHDWTKDDEIIASDMPWAVALYADRNSLWIPNKLRDLLGLSDQGKLDGTLAGVFLTPITRNSPFLSGIYKGEYQEYSSLVFGNTNIPYFPFREVALPAGDLTYTFYSDTKRWEKRTP